MQLVKGQQGPAIVLEALVDGQQPQLVGRVAQVPGQRLLAAVHHAGVHEGGERVDLVADGDVVLGAGRAGAEERDAVGLVLDAGVVGRDLRHRERLDWLTKGREGAQAEVALPLPSGPLVPSSCRDLWRPERDRCLGRHQQQPLSYRVNEQNTELGTWAAPGSGHRQASDPSSLKPHLSLSPSLCCACSPSGPDILLSVSLSQALSPFSPPPSVPSSASTTLPTPSPIPRHPPDPQTLSFFVMGVGAAPSVGRKQD